MSDHPSSVDGSDSNTVTSSGFTFNPFADEDAGTADDVDGPHASSSSAGSEQRPLNSHALPYSLNQAGGGHTMQHVKNIFRKQTTSSSENSSPVTALFSTTSQPDSAVQPSQEQRDSNTSIESPADTGITFGKSVLSALPTHRLRSSQSSIHSQNSAISSSAFSASSQPSVISFNTAVAQARLSTPIAGFRIPANSNAEMPSFPILEMCGPAFADTSGHPTYVCSAILGNAVHPGKAGPHLAPPVRISFAGKEVNHSGRYDILPLTAEMKWVSCSGGHPPEEHTAVAGGYEEGGAPLYHAVAKIDGCWVPGKAAPHLEGANFPFAGKEVRLVSICGRNCTM
ncbi:hypothetical protein EMMF5_001639 [Cystobasidiomycetes sp. EMM_F5]